MSGPCQGDCTYEKQDSCQEFSWAAGYVSHMAVCEGGRYYTLQHKSAGCASSGGDVRNDTEQGHPYGMECSMFDENEQHSTCTSAGSSPGISSSDDYYNISGGPECEEVVGVVVLKGPRNYDEAKQACEARGWDILGCPSLPEHVNHVKALLVDNGVGEAWVGVEPKSNASKRLVHLGRLTCRIV